VRTSSLVSFVDGILRLSFAPFFFLLGGAKDWGLLRLCSCLSCFRWTSCDGPKQRNLSHGLGIRPS
jgi:hypothetical protein